MALRLNKALGYALTDLIEDDPRINPDSPLLFWSRLEEEDEDFEVPTLDSYAAWLEAQAEVGLGGFGTRTEAKLLQSERSRSLHHLELTDAVVQPETGPDVLLLIPPVSLHRWCRSDDAIDYVETSLLPDGGQDNTLVALQRGLGAHSERFMDVDGTELNRDAQQFAYFAGMSMPEEELDNIASRIRTADPSLDRLMYSGAAEARERVVPCVPSDLRRLAEYGQLFTSGDVWKQLHPVLYTYWG
ncbi:hypothetical protein [Arthrobacter sp. UYCo732]|uniref:hypothetical protein n=1 Tax=Arthrobacter sp. UYCo732 TaxID=3156336 RepID=UPI003398CB61